MPKNVANYQKAVQGKSRKSNVFQAALGRKTLSSKPLCVSVSDTIIKLVFNVYNFPISDCTKYCYKTKINKAEHRKKGNVCVCGLL